MAKVQQIIGSFTGSPPRAFIGITCGDMLLTWTITESNVGSPVRTLGIFSNLYVRQSTGGVGTSTIPFRVNSANGNQVVSIGTGLTGEFTDTVNTDSPTAGQIVDLDLSSTVGELSVASVLFGANSGTVGRLGTGLGAIASGASTTTFFPPVGGASTSGGTEVGSQSQFTHACTLQNLAIVCTAKGRSKADTLNLRKNAANGNLTVSITGTGLFEDLTHSDSIAVNDKVCYAITTGSGASGNDSFAVFSVEQSSTDGAFQVLAGQNSPTFTSNNPTYFGGSIQFTTNAESVFQVALTNAASVSTLTCNIASNTAVGASTLTLRKNAADTALVASITGSTTGFFQDYTHSISFAAGDEANYTVGTGGDVIIASITALMTPSAPFSPDEDLFTVWQQAPFDPQITVWQ